MKDIWLTNFNEQGSMCGREKEGVRGEKGGGGSAVFIASLNELVLPQSPS